MENNPVKEYRKILTSYTKDLRSICSRSDDDAMEHLADVRGIKIDTLRNAGIFYIDSEVKILIPSYLDIIENLGMVSGKNRMPIYRDRYIIEIKDYAGLTAAHVGYSMNSNQKYMFSTPKYFSRRDGLYGLESIQRAIEKKFLIVVEGIMDKLRLNELGYDNVVSTMGSHQSSEHSELFNSFDFVIFIPDRDVAGNRTNNYWKTKRFFRLIVPIQYKDVDEFVREEKELGAECVINNIKGIMEMSKTHKFGCCQVVIVL